MRPEQWSTLYRLVRAFQENMLWAVTEAVSGSVSVSRGASVGSREAGT